MQKLLLTIAITSLMFAFTKAACQEPEWMPYKDQKCIKVLDAVNDFYSAVTTCRQELPIGSNFPSSILTIRTPKEQEFFQELIFNEVGVQDNVWLGASREENTNTSFRWPDGTTLEETYSNWGPENPIDENDRSCIEMRSNYSRNADIYSEGQWYNVPCTKGSNVVVCENLPNTSLPELKIQMNEVIRRIEAMEASVFEEVEETSWFGVF